jgi:hypothetical protein
VFLHSDANNPTPIAHGATGADYSDGKGCEPQQREPKAPVNAAKFTATTQNTGELANRLNDTNNLLIFKYYFFHSAQVSRQASHRESNARAMEVRLAGARSIHLNLTHCGDTNY